MKKLFLIAFLLLLGGGTARAQGQYVSGAITAADSGTECATVNGFVSIPVAVSATVSFSVSGTFSATLSFVTTVDGTNYAAVNAFPPNSTTAVTSTTGSGTWTVSVPAMATFCVRASAYTSGSATVNMRNSTLVNASIIGGGGEGGSGTTTNQTAKGISYNSSGTATAVDASIAAPATNGQYACGYTVTASAAVAPTCPQVGLAPDQAAGATVLYSDNNNVIYNPAAALSLPTPTTLANANFFTVIKTPGGTASTLTPVTWTVSLNGATAGASAVIPAYNSCTVNVDQVASTQWDANCSPIGLASPGPIGGTTPSTANFTILNNDCIVGMGSNTLASCVTATQSSLGRIIIPGGVTASISSSLNIAGLSNVYIMCMGGAASAQQGIILLTGTTGPVINASGGQAIRISGCQISWNNGAFSGDGIATGPNEATGMEIDHNIFVPLSGAPLATNCIYGKDLVSSNIHDNWIRNCAVGILGAPTASDFFNAVSIYNNVFSGGAGTISTSMIRNIETGNSISGNTFEMTIGTGSPSVISQTVAITSEGNSISGNYIGDTPSGYSGNIIDITSGDPEGWSFTGNLISHNTSATGSVFNFATAAFGINIEGNEICGPIILSSAANSVGIHVHANNFCGSITTGIHITAGNLNALEWSGNNGSPTTYLSGTPASGYVFNGSYVPLFYGGYHGVVCSGTIALPTSAISSGGKYGASSSTPLQTACTGMLTSDNVALTFNADPTGTTGYAPSANGGLTIVAYPDSGGGEIDLYLVNDTAGSITPSAATVNYKVMR